MKLAATMVSVTDVGDNFEKVTKVKTLNIMKS